VNYATPQIRLLKKAIPHQQDVERRNHVAKILASREIEPVNETQPRPVEEHLPGMPCGEVLATAPELSFSFEGEELGEKLQVSTALPPADDWIEHFLRDTEMRQGGVVFL
jgi:hypothetical protein